MTTPTTVPVTASRVPAFAGWLSAAGFLVGAAMIAGLSTFLAAPEVEYRETGAGQLADEAGFFAAVFAADGTQAAWVVLREAGLVVGFVGFAVLLAVAVRTVRPQGFALPIAATLSIVAASIMGVASALSLAPVLFRGDGWQETPAEITVAVGRALDVLGVARDWLVVVAFAVLAVSLAGTAVACRREAGLPRWVAPVAVVGAVALALLVVLNPTGWLPDIALWLVVVSGAVVAPVVSAGLGHHLSRSP